MALTTNRPLNKIRVYGYLADQSTAGNAYADVPVRGRVVLLGVINYAAVTTAPNVLTAKINTTSITIPTWTVTHSGAAAGDRVEVVPTAANQVAQGDKLNWITDGAGSGTVPCMFYADIVVN